MNSSKQLYHYCIFHNYAIVADLSMAKTNSEQKYSQFASWIEFARSAPQQILSKPNGDETDQLRVIVLNKTAITEGMSAVNFLIALSIKKYETPISVHTTVIIKSDHRVLSG